LCTQCVFVVVQVCALCRQWSLCTRLS